MALKTVTEKVLHLPGLLDFQHDTGSRYQTKLSDENAEISDWLIRIPHNQKNWGFGITITNAENRPWGSYFSTKIVHGDLISTLEYC